MYMITCFLKGGLGNQLFQIFTSISYAIQIKTNFKFFDVEYLGKGTTTIRKTYWNNFLKKLKPFLTKSFPELITVSETEEFRYKKLNIPKNKDICLNGYFQSYKYFDSYYKTIYNLLNIDNYKREILLQHNEPLSISLHFRLGDYKTKTDYHNIMSYEYYESCLTMLINKIQNESIHNVLYFYELEDYEIVKATIDKLQTKFINCKFVSVSNTLEDWQQMILMSCCKYNIIANSSFSWWAAYFNSNKDKIVLYPKTWFGPSYDYNTCDLFPPEWIMVKN